MPRALGDDYVLGKLIGSGGMGLVYVARQRSRARTVAVKLMRPEFDADAYMLRRFHTEAVVGSRVRHPNIAAVVDYGDTFLVMELIRGLKLTSLAADELSLARVVGLVSDLLAALAELHANGIVHADVKPDNVIVEEGTGSAKLIDFGLARFIDEPNQTMLSGTPEYLAPELITGGAPSVASDLYAVGIMLYELLAGMTPFAGDSMAGILAAHIDDEVVLPSLRCERAIPLAIEAVVLRALAKDPRNRFADARQFASALAAAMPDHDRASASVRGSRPAFSLERPTQSVVTAHRFAGGTNPGKHNLAVARVAIGAAIRNGDVPRMIHAYLALARALVDAQQLAEAAREIEEGIDVLTHGDGPLASDAPEPLWRLMLTLAALYDGLGDRIRARRIALDGHAHAERHGCHLGCARARCLINRLAPNAGS